MQEPLPLIPEARGGATLLLAPGVGLFTCARRRGQLLSPGEEAGVLLTLGRALPLIVPPGAEGRIQNEPPEWVHQPVGYRTLLYELAPLASEAEADLRSDPAAGAESGALVFRSPQSGRFYHRPSPDAPPFVSPGDALEDGAPIGLVEVMKTFAHLTYRAGPGLPPRARLVRILVADGAELEEGEPLLELEPA